MESEATGSRKVTKNELFSVLRNEHFFKFSSSRCIDRLVRYIQDLHRNENLSVDIEKQLKNIFKVFVNQLFAKWRASKSMYDRFAKRESKWLAVELKLPEMRATSVSPAPADVHDTSEPQPPSTYKHRGRPEKTFEASSKHTRKRKVISIVSQNTPEKLCLAAETSLIKSGKRTAAQVLNMASTSTPKRLKKMRKAYLSSSPSLVPYTSEEALGLMVDLGLTKEHYIQMRLGAKKRGADIYPSYHDIMEAKKKCYPPNIRITESEAVVPVQDLVDHTVQKLVQIQSQVIVENIESNIDTLDIYYKWGLDGSGGHSIYKQNFANNYMYADSNIILCTMVPLELSETKENRKKIYWKNDVTSSTRFCRPLSFKLKRENDQNMKVEYGEIELQIKQLRPTLVVLGERTIQVNHVFICTMVDGKTVNVLTDTKSTQACNVCKATPVTLNNIDDLQKRECNQDTYKFGLSILHSYLRTYEYLLHIAYKIQIKQWQARGKEVKNTIALRKKDICTKFYSKMGLVVDQPKQGGGNSNDGNTARKFFKNPGLVAEITGLSKDLIERYSNILATLSSGHYINEEKFKAYAIGTAKLTVSLYGWYKMSASVHKILVHGADIIKSLPLPVGQLSEDVLEASQKSYKNLRQFHSRKISRQHTNTDILNWMLISSDPVITNTRKKTKKEAFVHNETIRGMLRMPLFLASDVTAETNDETDENDI